MAAVRASKAQINLNTILTMQIKAHRLQEILQVSSCNVRRLVQQCFKIIPQDFSITKPGPGDAALSAAQ